MRRYLRIPEDVPAVNIDTDCPMVHEDTGAEVKISFARYARIITNRGFHVTEDEEGMREIRTKLTQLPGTIIALDDETQSYADFIGVVKHPRDAYGENLVVCLLTFGGFASAILNMSTEQPEHVGASTPDQPSKA